MSFKTAKKLMEATGSLAHPESYYHVAATSDVAIANVWVKVSSSGEVFQGQGSSKRATGDARDDVFGEKLALVRALQDLMDEILESEGFYFED